MLVEDNGIAWQDKKAFCISRCHNPDIILVERRKAFGDIRRTEFATKKEEEKRIDYFGV